MSQQPSPHQTQQPPPIEQPPPLPAQQQPSPHQPQQQHPAEDQPPPPQQQQPSTRHQPLPAQQQPFAEQPPPQHQPQQPLPTPPAQQQPPIEQQPQQPPPSPPLQHQPPLAQQPTPIEQPPPPPAQQQLPQQQLPLQHQPQQPPPPLPAQQQPSSHQPQQPPPTLPAQQQLPPQHQPLPAQQQPSSHQPQQPPPTLPAQQQLPPQHQPLPAQQQPSSHQPQQPPPTLPAQQQPPPQHQPLPAQQQPSSHQQPPPPQNRPKVRTTRDRSSLRTGPVLQTSKPVMCSAEAARWVRRMVETAPDIPPMASVTTAGEVFQAAAFNAMAVGALSHTELNMVKAIWSVPELRETLERQVREFKPFEDILKGGRQQVWPIQPSQKGSAAGAAAALTATTVPNPATATANRRAIENKLCDDVVAIFNREYSRAHRAVRIVSPSFEFGKTWRPDDKWVVENVSALATATPFPSVRVLLYQEALLAIGREASRREDLPGGWWALAEAMEGVLQAMATGSDAIETNWDRVLTVNADELEKRCGQLPASLGDTYCRLCDRWNPSGHRSERGAHWNWRPETAAGDDDSDGGGGGGGSGGAAAPAPAPAPPAAKAEDIRVRFHPPCCRACTYAWLSLPKSNPKRYEKVKNSLGKERIRPLDSAQMRWFGRPMLGDHENATGAWQALESDAEYEDILVGQKENELLAYMFARQAFVRRREEAAVQVAVPAAMPAMPATAPAGAVASEESDLTEPSSDKSSSSSSRPPPPSSRSAPSSSPKKIAFVPKEVIEISSSSDDSDDDVPLRLARKATESPSKGKSSSSDGSDDDVPLRLARKATESPSKGKGKGIEKDSGQTIQQRGGRASSHQGGRAAEEHMEQEISPRAAATLAVPASTSSDDAMEFEDPDDQMMWEWANMKI
ncbi:hypothetical protein A4X13_0g5823 [Tilletia indica]|uniref:Uncharacterized protein n=1 Tax=Tilletia indica TaxID=43049 RepID=A0A177TAG1_9BASI|nr:hypothetical protein A4X13_0g5823 [Tilletia indica]